MSLTPVLSRTFPVGSYTKGTVRYRTPDEMLVYQNFDMLSRRLQGMDMQVIYISPDNQLFHLHGKDAGREGVRLNTQLQGEQHWPFELVTTKGAFIYGADIERVNVNERMISFGIIIGGDAPHLTPYQYHLAEDHFWNGQDENRDGWLGIFTRFSGWRWIKVRPFSTVDTPQKKSPLANDQNTAMWDIKWIAGTPFYSKNTFREVWQAGLTNRSPSSLLDPRPYKGTIVLANRGDLPAPVKYIVSSPGQAAVSDGGTSRMVTMPLTIASDGNYLVDTEDGHRVLTASTERIDNIFYERIRASRLLDFALHDLASLGEPLGYRFNKRFLYTIPPRSIAHLNVEHSSSTGVIAAFVPQRFKRSR
jgi:hypothetical protein